MDISNDLFIDLHGHNTAKKENAKVLRMEKVIISPQCEADLERISKKLFNIFYDDFHKEIYKAVRSASVSIKESATEAQTLLSETIKEESAKATKRIRQSSNAIIIPAPWAWILAIILFFSLVLNVAMASANACLWHIPQLTDLLLDIFAIISLTTILTIVYSYFIGKT